MNREGIYIVKNNLEEDSLSRMIKRFSLEVHGFGHQYNDKAAVCDYRVIGDYELIFVLGGDSLITMGQTVHKLGEGDVILIPPFVRHRIDTREDNPHDNYWIHFDVYPFYRQNEFTDLLSRGIGQIDAGFFRNQLLPLLRQMEYETAETDYGSYSYFETLFLQVVIQIFRNHYEEQGFPEWNQRQNMGEFEIVDRGMQFIRQNTESPIQVKDLCDHLHISESYLYKTYSKTMNLSPNYLIQLYKVKRGEQLLKTTSYSVKEISEMLCFSSPYYFSTVFKKFYGVSPGKLKRQYGTKTVHFETRNQPQDMIGLR